MIPCEYGTLRLIDPANRTNLHWSSDFARFCVDLWISVLDKGTESFVWEKIKTWESDFINWYKKEKKEEVLKDKTGYNCKVLTALYWIRENIFTFFEKTESKYNWEFYIILADEFLIQCTNKEISTPKRCFALLAAYELICHIGKNVPEECLKK